MTAWATIVAERIGFKREEALSIGTDISSEALYCSHLAWPTASAYTEMNAISKGVSLGIYKDSAERGMEAVKGGSQSYVELMGRRYVKPCICVSSQPTELFACYTTLARMFV